MTPTHVLPTPNPTHTSLGPTYLRSPRAKPNPRKGDVLDPERSRPRDPAVRGHLASPCNATLGSAACLALPCHALPCHALPGSGQIRTTKVLTPYACVVRTHAVRTRTACIACAGAGARAHVRSRVRTDCGIHTYLVVRRASSLRCLLLPCRGVSCVCAIGIQSQVQVQIQTNP
ncbi:uncharacterized protein K452DRAFT_125043 [Aplosporella prunicola CBS 121167]|uniref:Uncharacterized protein n=1 Tax=Aplosporella prunicola CBS 121167 TaxID=1176127 RepID=A0A6A6BPU7_9PEZI|nr:uncharacterized protein K452DRAFT_125043 [Aplosporella prunicola CBS 121167]KAF2145758.1 hypothetical protein K452DRAFT_125043 [Aplosporella prunicola CBS 121167]